MLPYKLIASPNVEATKGAHHVGGRARVAPRAQSPRHIPQSAAGGPAATSTCSRPPTARYAACDRAPGARWRTPRGRCRTHSRVSFGCFPLSLVSPPLPVAGGGLRVDSREVKENSAQGTSLMPRAGRKRRGKLREGCRALHPPAPGFLHHSEVRCFLSPRSLSETPPRRTRPPRRTLSRTTNGTWGAPSSPCEGGRS